MRKLLTVAVAAALPLGCDSGQTNVLGGVPAIAFISRTPVDTGNVFDYTGNGKDANLFTLTPPSASGRRLNLTNWTGADITSMDVSFDAREIVFSARAPGDDHYHLFRINVDGTNPCDAALGKASKGPCQISMGTADEVYPRYLPSDRIFYITNQNVEGGATPQFNDEYERARSGQVGVMMKDGSGRQEGPRNVSHRVAPTVLSDGRVLMTEWRHLGDVNEGDLTVMQQDLTGTREAFGREQKGIANSYLRARELAPGVLVAIATARDRTYQAGAIVRIHLGGADISTQSEANSSAENLTPAVPLDRTPSYQNVGRYYDVAPLPNTSDRFLVTWADGPVETTVLSMGKQTPDFGIYVYDAKSQTRFPVVNDLNSWELSPMPIIPRNEPPAEKALFPATGAAGTLLAAVNVYDSTMFPRLAAQKGAVKVRITEGFSTEEGFPSMFGLSEFDGQARLGEVAVNSDGSFKALVPANTPVRLQLVDKYGMALATDGASPGGDTANEPVWIQGRPGESRVCGGCHESRTEAIALAPGSSLLQVAGAPDLFSTVDRRDRLSDDFSYDKVMGVPWDKALQPIFDKHCIDCHDGSAGTANPSYTVTDITDMTTLNFTFNLTSAPVTINTGDRVMTFSSSYVSLLGLSMAFDEKNIMVSGDANAINGFVSPGKAHDSVTIKLLNPPARFPSVNPNDRAFAGQPVHPGEVGTYNGHDGADAKYQLSADEYYLLILNFDDGGQYYFRENAPGRM